MDERVEMLVEDRLVPSEVLRERVLVRVLRPARRPSGAGGGHWVWLLHGRGGGVAEMSPGIQALADAVTAGELAPLTLAAPDAPWLERSSWFVDGAAGPDGRAGPAVETALVDDVLPSVESALGAPGGRHQRTIAGISMGGAAALRYALVHRHMFGSALLLSPAVYEHGPPPSSSARVGGAFRAGDQPFSPSRWQSLMDYRTLLAEACVTDAEPLAVATVVGDGEPLSGSAHAYDLDLEAARLHTALKRQAHVRTTLRVVAGGHDWAVWSAGLVTGLQQVRPARAGPPAVPG